VPAATGVALGMRTVAVGEDGLTGWCAGRARAGTSDAVAVARATVREGVQTLQMARPDERALALRLLVDHRDDLVAQREPWPPCADDWFGRAAGRGV
jgi:hypothetical protein